jgi:hypothetical protein
MAAALRQPFISSASGAAKLWQPEICPPAFFHLSRHRAGRNLEAMYRRLSHVLQTLRLSIVLIGLLQLCVVPVSSLGEISRTTHQIAIQAPAPLLLAARPEQAAITSTRIAAVSPDTSGGASDLPSVIRASTTAVPPARWIQRMLAAQDRAIARHQSANTPPRARSPPVA